MRNRRCFVLSNLPILLKNCHIVTPGQVSHQFLHSCEILEIIHIGWLVVIMGRGNKHLIWGQRESEEGDVSSQCFHPLPLLLHPSLLFRCDLSRSLGFVYSSDTYIWILAPQNIYWSNITVSWLLDSNRYIEKPQWIMFVCQNSFWLSILQILLWFKKEIHHKSG